eukprot:1894129-Prymnesium_polylepis.1
MGGSNNDGAYCFEVRAQTPLASRLLDAGAGPSAAASDQIVMIDAEDPHRSSWCRYINEARGDAPNLRARVDTAGLLVWFEAVRDIDAGEELCFHPVYRAYGMDGARLRARARRRGSMVAAGAESVARVVVDLAGGRGECDGRRGARRVGDGAGAHRLIHSSNWQREPDGGHSWTHRRDDCEHRAVTRETAGLPERRRSPIT